MKVNTKLVCAASLAALLTVGMATPSYAAPADRASFVAQSVAAALKGLGGLDAKARARLLGAVVSSVAGKGGLSGDDLATAIGFYILEQDGTESLFGKSVNGDTDCYQVIGNVFQNLSTNHL